MNGNVYDLADYSRKGLLIDAYHELGEKGVERELKLLVPFMYCSGRGLTLKQGHLFNLSAINTSNVPTQSKSSSSSSSSSNFLHRKKVSSSSATAGDKYSTPFSVSEIDTLFIHPTHYYSLLFQTLSDLKLFDMKKKTVV